MSFGKTARVKFKASDSTDVVAYRVRIAPPNSAFDLAVPFDEVPVPTPEADGFSYIKVADLPKAVNLDGAFDIHLTAIDDAGTESPALEIDNVDFDFAPPTAPTEGSVVAE